MNSSKRNRVVIREFARRRVRTVTAWSATGATAVAAVLGVVLANGTATAATNKPATPPPANNGSGAGSTSTPGSTSSNSSNGSSSNTGGLSTPTTVPTYVDPNAGSAGGGYSYSGGNQASSGGS